MARRERHAVNDHYHYGYAEERHYHRGYADERHDHDYAERDHRHYDDERTAAGLREDLNRAYERISELEEIASRIDDEMRTLWDHIHNMPGGT